MLTLGSGAFVGFVLGVVGGGGSILALPLLIYVVGVKDTHIAVGTSAVAVAASALGNLFLHARAGSVRWRAAALFAIPGTLGAYLGATLGRRTQATYLLVAFAAAMIVIAVRMLWASPPAQTDCRGAPCEQAALHRLLPFGFGTGLMAGFLGIGGGFLIVPGLLAATDMSMLNAVGSSLVGVMLFGLATGINYLRAGLIDWPLTAQMIVGGVLGGVLGQRLAVTLSRRRDLLARTFGGALLVVAAYILARETGLLT